jgi:hypothetical protein
MFLARIVRNIADTYEHVTDNYNQCKTERLVNLKKKKTEICDEHLTVWTIIADRPAT